MQHDTPRSSLAESALSGRPTLDAAPAEKLRRPENAAKRRAILSLLLVALVWVIFHPVLGFEFVGWDDDIAVTRNGLVTDDWSWVVVGKMFSGDTTLRFKPAHWAIVRVWHDLFGLDPMAWHALNLGLHLTTAVLVFLVLAQALPLVASPAAGWRSDAAAWTAAAVWAVHPLRVEPVAWVTASSYPLATAWLLASFSCYLKSPAAGSGGTAVNRWSVGSWCLAVLAYGSYPIALTYCAWLMVVDIGLLKTAPRRLWKWSNPDVRRWWTKHLLFLSPAVVSLVMTAASRFWSPGAFTEAPTLTQAPMADRLLMAFASIGSFPISAFWPLGLTPNHQSLEGSAFSDLRVLGMAAFAVLLLGSIALVPKLRRSFGWVTVGWVGLSAPCLGLTEFPVWPVDRYSYLLDIVLWGGVAGAALALFGATRKYGSVIVAIGGAGAALVLWLFGSMSGWLLPIWRDSDQLFMHMEGDPQTIASRPTQAHLYVLWARHAARQKAPAATVLRINQAQRAYVAAIMDALKADDFATAVEMADRLRSDIGMSLVLRRERAGWLARLGRTAEARSELLEVLRVNASDARAADMLESLAPSR